MPIIRKNFYHEFSQEDRNNCVPVIYPTPYLRNHPNNPYHDTHDLNGKNWEWVNYTQFVRYKDTYNHYEATGIKVFPFINDYWYESVKQVLQQTGMDIVFDDEKHGFSLFGCKFYMVCCTNSSSNGKTCTYPFIFQEDDYNVYLNSFQCEFSLWPINNITEILSSNEITQYCANSSFMRNPADWFNPVSDVNVVYDSTYGYKSWELLKYMQFTLTCRHGENWISLQYGNEGKNNTMDYFFIENCDRIDGGHVVYTSKNPLRPFFLYVNTTTWDSNCKYILRIDDIVLTASHSDGEYGSNRASFYQSAINELTLPEDHLRPLMYRRSKNHYYRNMCLNYYFMDIQHPFSEEEEIMFGPEGMMPDGAGKHRSILRGATMFSGTITVPNTYLVDISKFQGYDNYYRINGDDYWCPYNGILFKL